MVSFYSGIHATIPDIDISPLLQVGEAAQLGPLSAPRGYGAPLTAAELELMNLTGDGNDSDRCDDAAGVPCADRKFLPAVGLRTQSGGAPHARGGAILQQGRGRIAAGVYLTTVKLR